MNQTIDYFLGVKGDKMKSRFVCDISNARLAGNTIDRSEEFVAKYVVERVVYLARDYFIYFREHLLEENLISLNTSTKCILITKVVFM